MEQPLVGKKIIIAGGSGFIGKKLSRQFQDDGASVVILTRDASRVVSPTLSHVQWDPQANKIPWASCLDNGFAVVNLAGSSVNVRPTESHRQEILRSRLDAVSVLAKGMRETPTPPPLWIQASAIGYYGETADKEVDESAPPGSGFLADVCRQWESAAHGAVREGQRLVIGRIGVVLGREGGAYPVLAKLVKAFLGGSAGLGQQFVSWIHVDDVVGLFRSFVLSESCEGAVNICSPGATTNACLMKTLRKILKRPWSPPVPPVAIRLGAMVMGTNPELVLGSTRVSPTKALSAGYQFQFPELSAALSNLA